MTQKTKKRRDEERCLHKSRCHAFWCAIVIVVCVAVAFYSSDAHTVTFSAKIAELTAAAVGYWWLFGSLEL